MRAKLLVITGVFVGAVSSSGAGAQAALSKELLASTYSAKYEHLQSATFAYSQDWLIFDTKRQEVRKRRVEELDFLMKGKRILGTRTTTNPGDGSTHVNRIFLLDDTMEKTLLPSADATVPDRGIIRTSNATSHMNSLGADPLGYAMLHPMPASIDGNGLQNYMNFDFRVLMEQEESVILPEMETLDNRRTYVVEWRRGTEVRQRWWVDPAIGLAVVKRESFAGLDDGSTYLYLEVEFSDFDEIEPGFFLPKSGVSRSFETDSTMSDERIYSQIKLETNVEIDDSAFVLEFPEGTSIEDERIVAINAIRTK